MESNLNFACSDDIVLEIIAACTQHRGLLRNLSTVSKQFHRLSIPVLYRRVDISVHDEPDISTECRSPEPRYDFEWLIPRQHSFLQTLVQHPEYGKLVRYFKWTLCWSLWDDFSEENHLSTIEYRTWDVFLGLTNVVDVDLGCHQAVQQEMGEYPRQNPPNLFETARRVRLFGHMHFKLASAVLRSINLSMLEYLALDDVQEIGHYPNGLPIHEDHGTYLDSILELVQTHKVQDLVLPGPIRCLLYPLQGRCSALQYLYFRKWGPDTPILESEDYYHADDTAVYAEFASFLQSVKPTLHIFSFEQGYQRVHWTHGYGWGVAQAQRPMDRDFVQHVFPVILSGGWTSLQRLEIRGVGSWRGQSAMTQTMKEDIYKAVANTDVVIEEEARPLWKCTGMYGHYFDRVRHYSLH